MPTWIGWILNWLWGKIIPIVIDYAKKTFRKKQIDRDENKQLNAIDEIKKQIKDYQEKHNVKTIPPHLKQKLREAARRRVGDL